MTLFNPNSIVLSITKAETEVNSISAVIQKDPGILSRDLRECFCLTLLALCYLGKSFEHVHRSAKYIFVPSATIQHDLIIRIAFYKPYAIIPIIRLSDGIACEFHAINAILFVWHLIIKIIMTTTKRLRIVFVIAQTIILSIGADAKVKRDVVTDAAIYVIILLTYLENVLFLIGVQIHKDAFRYCGESYSPIPFHQAATNPQFIYRMQRIFPMIH